MVWHIQEGRYADVKLDGLNVVMLGGFTGNVWVGPVTDSEMVIFFDERADKEQREALQKIFRGEGGGWPATFAETVDTIRQVEFGPIEFEVSADLRWWSARIPGRVEARGEALQGPTSDGKLVQVHHPAGAEVGPGTVATQTVAVLDKADGYDFRWERTGQSSKHMPFDWSGPRKTRAGMRRMRWAFMLVLALLGMMSPVWMAAVAAVIFSEKVFPAGHRVGVAVAVLLLVGGTAASISPGALTMPA